MPKLTEAERKVLTDQITNSVDKAIRKGVAVYGEFSEIIYEVIKNWDDEDDWDDDDSEDSE